MKTSLSIKTLKFRQLHERWPELSRENIYELAEQGFFGLYIKPHRKRKTYHDIEDHLKSLIEKEAGNDYYTELMHDFADFIITNALIIKAKLGYARLATSAEVKIFSLCEASSIQFLNQYKRIDFYEYNNTFGIIKENNLYICNTFLLRSTSLTGKHPEDYKGYFSDEDISVFIDQIEYFEQSKLYKETLHAISGQKNRNKSAKNNGKKSGIARKEIADQNWLEIKPLILQIAKQHPKKTANFISNLAVRKKIITVTQQSNIAKKIRLDVELIIINALINKNTQPCNRFRTRK